MPKFEIGTHDVHVINTGIGAPAEGKKGFLFAEFEGQNGERITARLYTTPAAWPHTAKKLAAIGWDAEQNGFRFEELNSSPSVCEGKECTITVELEEWEDEEGKIQQGVKVGWINPIGGGGAKRMDEDAAAQFAAGLRARLTGGAAPAAAPATRRRTQRTRRAAEELPPHMNEGPDPDEGDELPY